MNWLIDDLKCVTAVFLIITLACFYTYLKINYSYWDRKGFKTLPGTVFFFGHIKSNFFGKEMMANIVKNLYDKTSEPFIGFYALLRPILIIRDTQLIRNILVKDFTYFRDRGVYVNEKDDPLSGHLVALGGEKWRFLRTKLTPTFTSGKLKGMFGTLVDCGTNLQTYLGKLSDQNEVLDVQEIAASHATNVIASVSFGLDVDAITNPDTDFRTFGRKMFTPTIQNSFRIMLLTCAPKLMKFFRVKCVSSDVEKFVLSIVKQNLIYREENKVTRKDFFQLLIQLRNGEKISEESDDWNSTIKSNENQKTFTVNEMAAQSYIFFAAGFETSSSTLSFCLNELAKNPEIQSRVYEEINRVLEKHGGEITYDSVAEMKYLENCIDESLRKYPIGAFLRRNCAENYKIPGTNKTLEKGSEIFIPVFALHRDEAYYPNPEKFDPDRFNEENSVGKNLVNRPYYPFGDGPRNCIGLRLGKLQVKVGLLMMLQHFRYEVLNEVDRTREIEFEPRSFLLAPRGGIKLRVLRR